MAGVDYLDHMRAYYVVEHAGGVGGNTYSRASSMSASSMHMSCGWLLTVHCRPTLVSSPSRPSNFSLSKTCAMEMMSVRSRCQQQLTTCTYSASSPMTLWTANHWSGLWTASARATCVHASRGEWLVDHVETSFGCFICKVYLGEVYLGKVYLGEAGVCFRQYHDL